MNMTAPRSNHLKDQFGETVEATIERSKDAFETMGAATTEATEAMQNIFSAALKGIQEYNSKVVEFTRANTESYIEFVQQLAGAKSPMVFVEIFNDNSRHQLARLTEQAKELAALAQEIAGSATEPLKTGIEKAKRVPRYRA